MANVVEELVSAMNAHDLERLVGMFHVDYRSEQPAHPARAFTGSAQMQANWAAMFTGIPDIRAEVHRLAVDGDTTWLEQSWLGTRTDGLPFHMRGVCLFQVRDGLIVAGRLYMEEVESPGSGIEQVVRGLSGRAPEAIHRQHDGGSGHD